MWLRKKILEKRRSALSTANFELKTSRIRSLISTNWAIIVQGHKNNSIFDHIMTWVMDFIRCFTLMNSKILLKTKSDAGKYFVSEVDNTTWHLLQVLSFWSYQLPLLYDLYKLVCPDSFVKQLSLTEWFSSLTLNPTLKNTMKELIILGMKCSPTRSYILRA